MKKIGMVGGVAWPSTVEFYQAICRMSQRWHEAEAAAGRAFVGPAPMPEFSIESVNVNHSFSLRGQPGDEASWQRYDAYFNAALRRLQSAGADFALIASNTPHNRFEAITAGLTMPVLSIFETVSAACVKAGLSDVLILGTRPTLESDAFSAVLARHGVRGHKPPREADREALYRLIMGLYAERSGEAAALMSEIAERSFAELGIAAGPQRAVSLSCTELPLAFPSLQHLAQFESQGLRWLNTTKVHAQAAFAACLD
ncbi:aspartate/glutamate racemase family protein [Paucibacter sp. APW11]|uniref:Aspartate/glutamate racemase family protein n=1 Tax=Roseateles aquae TaxID=3077235 RepID=A0ABU3P6I5_9BURK|nr:aspartate/glutamate racemase family protein [Paucibacter sp. APW11]MDT8998177.1 aspartate/glutamate racemase family protein [Paucibacter sp. APW11]